MGTDEADSVNDEDNEARGEASTNRATRASPNRATPGGEGGEVAAKGATVGGGGGGGKGEEEGKEEGGADCEVGECGMEPKAMVDVWGFLEFQLPRCGRP